MNSHYIRKKMFAFTLTGALLIPQQNVFAADTTKEEVKPQKEVGAVLEEYQSGYIALEVAEQLAQVKEILEEEKEKQKYMDMAFSSVREDSFLYIRSEPTTESEWVGKLYSGAAAKVTGPIEEWTKVESGGISGYVKTEYIITTAEAKAHAEALVAQAGGEETQAFSYAKSRVEEEARLAEEARIKADEEAKRQEKAKEAMAAVAGSGQAVVDYASQFIGNPYVWGGTSLTNGADCSGFIQSVYAQFGVSMPRTSGQMRGAGRAVSYEQAMPGDVICYEGHVGIYMGNGKVVNAIDEAHGIGISNAQMMPIITIRRLL